MGEWIRSLESVAMNIEASFWKGRRVLLTGHTGFKGAWLTIWLNKLGAIVYGYALDPPSQPALFSVANLGSLLAEDIRADIRDRTALLAAFERAKPEVVLHLAAQSLVRESYRKPVETYDINVMGTVNLLEAARHCPTTKAVVIVTTDKCYENQEWVHPYRETDPMGGHDPYSSSKACAEIVTAAYRSSFFQSVQGSSEAAIASARAGNVIGGGDWAADRLVPDCIRAFQLGQSVYLRHPQSIRPWQHVLEPLAGYLSLAERLCGSDAGRFATGWNFGPAPEDDAAVGIVADRLAGLWGQGATVTIDPAGQHPHEANLLRLDVTKARVLLGWQPKWRLDTALRQTVEWYRAWLRNEDMAAVCRGQIDEYLGQSA